MSLDSTLRIAQSHLDRGDPLGWFDEVYKAHGDNPSEIPWADRGANDLLLSWLDSIPMVERACVVGCGLGDDAAELARRKASVTAFDLSPTAIALAAKRFPDLGITWQAANLLELPEGWRQSFDFIFEAYTLQSLPANIRQQAFEAVANMVAPGGELLLVARVREVTDALPTAPPWPLTRDELLANPPGGLIVDREEEHPPSDKHPARRIRVSYRREM